ncbi:hypothetical protein DQ384_39760 [Sphaerisporangium album]|uniref:Uncharacterized protein n=1 Tax=Sphaerisporangium album TaxID=509200 RepID=A0A367EH73_9ACTN|nr:hypothetical protein [Sphaerisporangium album]RCG17414.1 hypothetical protein DQ384_39760 [Sphaerisporangium album]
MTLSATEGEAGHGPHVLEPQPDHVRIQWHTATHSEDRRRVLRWTCECRPVVYYLVTAGGQGYVERTGPGPTMVQTARMRHVQVADLWELILLGRAR